MEINYYYYNVAMYYLVFIRNMLFACKTLCCFPTDYISSMYFIIEYTQYVWAIHEWLQCVQSIYYKKYKIHSVCQIYKLLVSRTKNNLRRLKLKQTIFDERLVCITTLWHYYYHIYSTPGIFYMRIFDSINK